MQLPRLIYYFIFFSCCVAFPACRKRHYELLLFANCYWSEQAHVSALLESLCASKVSAIIYSSAFSMYILSGGTSGIWRKSCSTFSYAVGLLVPLRILCLITFPSLTKSSIRYFTSP